MSLGLLFAINCLFQVRWNRRLQSIDISKCRWGCCSQSIVSFKFGGTVVRNQRLLLVSLNVLIAINGYFHVQLKVLLQVSFVHDLRKRPVDCRFLLFLTNLP